MRLANWFWNWLGRPRTEERGREEMTLGEAHIKVARLESRMAIIEARRANIAREDNGEIHG